MVAGWKRTGGGGSGDDWVAGRWCDSGVWHIGVVAVMESRWHLGRLWRVAWRHREARTRPVSWKDDTQEGGDEGGAGRREVASSHGRDNADAVLRLSK
ncbi:hypothetical protein E2562_023031 [Oryza meyeriana var. granulata]|uniref:Uncharacterized protein n=1 Tax=Oryza meyeriana var. granulata TaxID=110450 RepID=A0A6G1EYG7_9ORYZ|nr:hypothetical protein E2562_023031 [Oryza meyeriana var. granulata]